MTKQLRAMATKAAVCFKSSMASRKGEYYIDILIKIIIMVMLGVVVALLIRTFTLDSIDNAHENVNNILTNVS